MEILVFKIGSIPISPTLQYHVAINLFQAYWDWLIAIKSSMINRNISSCYSTVQKEMDTHHNTFMIRIFYLGFSGFDLY